MAERDRQNDDLARRLARLAAEAARRGRQRRAGDADAAARDRTAEPPPPRREALAPAAPGGGRRARAEKIAEPARHVGRVMAAQGVVGDRAGQLAQPPLERRRAFPACRKSGPRSRAGTACPRTARRARAPRRSPPRRPNERDRQGPGPPAAARIGGSCPAPISGSAVSMARKAALRPALSPSKHRIGSRPSSTAARIDPRSAPCRAARPLGKPGLGHGDDVDIALDRRSPRRARAPALRARWWL